MTARMKKAHQATTTMYAMATTRRMAQITNKTVSVFGWLSISDQPKALRALANDATFMA